MLRVLALLILTFSVGIGAQTTKKEAAPKKDKSQKISNLLAQEEYLIRNLKRKSPKLWWRLIEIQTEKLNILKKKENANFLASSIKGIKKPKAYYFQESRKLSQNIRREALWVIKKWPDYRYVGDIYYTLALNNRDYGDKNKVEYYLKKSLRLSGHSKSLRHKVKIALAEHYYNNKKYAKAISYYKTIIKNSKDKWQAKHLYNYSWCLTKKGLYDRAITHARLSLVVGKKRGQVSVSEQLFNNLGLFFIMAGKINDGVEFYLEELDDATIYLNKMAKKAIKDLGFKPAHDIYQKALADSIKKKHVHSTSLIYLEQLDLFRQFKKDDLYWQTAHALEKHSVAVKMMPEHLERAVTAIKSYTHLLQAHFKNNVERYQVGQDNTKKILRYLGILITLDRVNSDFYRYYQAEIHLALKNYLPALEHYKKALEHSKILTEKTPEYPKHLKHRTLIFDALFHTLGGKGLAEKEKREFTLYSYLNHIALFPKNPRTRAIYPKLYYLYTQKKEYTKALAMLDQYIKAYPKDLKTQRELYTKAIDHYIESNDLEMLTDMILKVEDGFLSYSKSYIKKALHVLSNLIFNKYEKLAKEGKVNDAITGYENLYKKEKTPKSLKGNAAYNIATLNIKLGKIDLATRWFKISYKLIPMEDKLKLGQNILDISNQLFLEQEFASSVQIAKSFAGFHCRQTYQGENELFVLWLNGLLMQKKGKSAISLVKTIQRCVKDQKIINQSIVSVGHYIYRYYSTGVFISFIKKFYRNTEYKKMAHNQLKERYWQHYSRNEEKQQKQVINFVKKTKIQSFKQAQDLQELVTFQEGYHPVVQSKKYKFNVLANYSSYKKFPEEKFNGALEKNMALIQTVTQKLTPFTQSSNPYIAAQSISFMVKYLDSFTSDLQEVDPKGLGPEYNKGFKQAMLALAQNVKTQKATYEKGLNQIILSSHILLNPYKKDIMLSKTKAHKKLKYRHPASLYILPIDHKKTDGNSTAYHQGGGQ